MSLKREDNVFAHQMMITLVGETFLRFGSAPDRFVSYMTLSPAHVDSSADLDGGGTADKVQLDPAWAAVMQSTAVQVWPPVLSVSEKNTMHLLDLGLKKLQPKAARREKTEAGVRTRGPAAPDDPDDTSATGIAHTHSFEHAQRPSI